MLKKTDCKMCLCNSREVKEIIKFEKCQVRNIKVIKMLNVDSSNKMVYTIHNTNAISSSA